MTTGGTYSDSDVDDVRVPHVGRPARQLPLRDDGGFERESVAAAVVVLDGGVLAICIRVDDGDREACQVGNRGRGNGGVEGPPFEGRGVRVDSCRVGVALCRWSREDLGGLMLAVEMDYHLALVGVRGVVDSQLDWVLR